MDQDLPCVSEPFLCPQQQHEDLSAKKLRLTKPSKSAALHVDLCKATSPADALQYLLQFARKPVEVESVEGVVRILLEHYYKVMKLGAKRSWSHKNIGRFGLKGTFRGHLAQPPCHEQRHLELDQVAQSPIQPDLECFQGWDIEHLSGQPVPVFHHPHGKKFLPCLQSKSLLLV